MGVEPAASEAVADQQALHFARHHALIISIDTYEKVSPLIASAAYDPSARPFIAMTALQDALRSLTRPPSPTLS